MFFDSQVFGLIFNFKNRYKLNLLKSSMIPYISGFESGTCVYLYKKNNWKIPKNIAEVVSDIFVFDDGPCLLKESIESTLDFLSESDVDSNRNLFVFSDHLNESQDALTECISYDRDRKINFNFYWCFFDVNKLPCFDDPNVTVLNCHEPEEAVLLLKKVYDARKRY